MPALHHGSLGKHLSSLCPEAKQNISRSNEPRGISFNPNRHVVNTLKSHCLLDYAATENKQDAVAESLFHHYFEQAHNISREDVLQQVASEAGLDATAAMKHVDDKGVASRVKAEGLEARQHGVNGVPFFSIIAKGCPDPPVAFSGAQPPDTFKKVFSRLLNQLKSSI
ncbi:predicted protein [Nematostella vectensis]|uniref:DSBA-like thioredoxin domain-containing protein n=1 Tax=Nematostella vectensis TaxID=45351 RepID=A7RV26_NEMVE|nr:predicted protein [Nematostella vectensis]|eukprot:XP_001636775.1 predicted protein [Nematostella vectensis]